MKKRLGYLEGVRAFAALNVIFCHFVCVYYPQCYFEDAAQAKGGILSLFATSPLTVFVNGNVAVQFFFVITGFLVGRSVFLKKEMTADQVCDKCIKRYSRLIPIVLVATVFTFITMVAGLQHHLSIADKVANGKFLLDYCNFKPTIKNLLVDVFINPFFDKSIYVGPFWTIKYEFIGYIISMAVAYITRNSKYRRLVYIVLTCAFVFFFNPTYSGFIFGLLVADLCFNTDKDTTILSKYYQNIIRSKIFLAIISIIGMYFACCTLFYTSIYKKWQLLYIIFGRDVPTGVLRAFGVAILIYVLCNVKWLQRVFSVKPLQWLGKISFSVYAFHWPIMLTAQAWIFDALYKQVSYDVAAVLSLVIVIPIIHLVGYISWYFIENKDFFKFLRKKEIKNTA